MSEELDIRHDLKRFSDLRQGERVAGIGASSIDTCYKQLAYQYLRIEPTQRRGTDAADLGTLIHAGWSAMITRMHGREVRDCDVVLHLDELPRSISADDVDYGHRVVRDVKTAKDTVWQSWLNTGSPYESHWDQLHMYGLALHRKHGGDWTLCIVAINRETGKIVEYEREFDLERALALAARAADRHAALQAAADVVESGEASADHMVETFPREGKGPGRGMPCDYCDWLDVCWPEPSVDGGTPQSETVREDDEAIGALAEEYLAAAAEGRKYEQRRKDAQAFLQGVNGEFPGPDGNTYRVRMIGGTPGAPVVDCEKAADLLIAADIEVPMKEGRPSARYPRVDKVRK